MENRQLCPKCGGSGVVYHVEKITDGYRGEVDACPVCRGTGAVPAARTHGDAIRAMTDQALAMWMLGLVEGTDVSRYCRNLPECDADLEADRLIPLERCQACLVHWLQQPEEGGEEDGRQT